MMIMSSPLCVSDAPLREAQKAALCQDSNAMKGFLIPQQSFPPGFYLSYYVEGLFVGACRLEQEPYVVGKTITIHPLFLSHPNAKTFSRHLIELTILYTLQAQLKPTTFIKTDNIRMNNFAKRLGLSWVEECDGYTHYELPEAWKPKHIDHFAVLY